MVSLGGPKPIGEQKIKIMVILETLRNIVTGTYNMTLYLLRRKGGCEEETPVLGVEHKLYTANSLEGRLVLPSLHLHNILPQ